MVADCIFCRIVAKEIPATIVHEDDDVLAFRDLNPQAPVHILVIPKQHIDGVANAAARHGATLGAVLLRGAEIARAEGHAEQGYRLVINQGANGGQTVGHLHMHILAGRQMTWPPG